jgi:hypothetical protein
MPRHELAKDPRQVVACLRRLDKWNEGFIFYNAAGDFRCMLRNDPMDKTDDHMLTAEVALLDDREEDTDSDCTTDSWTHTLQKEVDGYWDDSSSFVVESLSVPKASNGIDCERAKSATDKINDVYNWRRCGCRQYLIKESDATMCLRCELSATVEEAQIVQCIMCSENVPQKHMRRQVCCGQMVHTACLEKWSKKRGCDDGMLAPCPLCRGCIAITGATSDK